MTDKVGVPVGMWEKSLTNTSIPVRQEYVMAEVQRALNAWMERAEKAESERDELRVENELLTRRSNHYEENWKNAEHVILLRDDEIERLRADVTRMDIAIQNVWAVIDNLDNALVSPTSDEKDVLDVLRVALRKGLIAI